MELKIGDDVVTDHGEGFVIGWEAFDGGGMTAELSKVDNGNRVAVKLYAGHIWCFDGLYFERSEYLKKAD